MKRKQILNERHLSVIIIVLLVLLNIVIKSAYLTHHCIDADEPMTIISAQASFSDLLGLLKQDLNQPLFFIIMHFWIRIFGIGIVSLRFLPMLFSSLAVIFVYLIGKKHYNLTIAFGASLVYTFSNLGIFHAHDARVYGIFVFLATLSMYCYFSMIGAESKRKFAIVLTITNVLILYAHVCGIFVIVIQALYTLIFSAIRKNNFRIYFPSFVITVIAFLPYIIFKLSFVPEHIQYINGLVSVPTINNTNDILSGFSNDINNYIWFMSILLFFFLIAIISGRKISMVDKMIFGWFVIPFFLMIVIATQVHFTLIRFMIFITPGFYLSVIVAAYYLIKNKLIAKLLVVLCVCTMFATINLKSSYDMKASEAVAVVKNYKTTTTRVYILPKWMSRVFSYHYKRELILDYKNTEDRLNKDNIFLIDSVAEIDTSRFANVSNVLLFEGWNNLALLDPQNKIYNTLHQKFKKATIISRVSGYSVYKFGPKP